MIENGLPAVFQTLEFPADANVEIAVSLGHIPGVAPQFVVETPEMALGIVVFVFEFLLDGDNLILFRPGFNATEKNPVDATIGTACSHQIFAAILIVDDVAVVRLAHTFGQVLNNGHTRSFV